MSDVFSKILRPDEGKKRSYKNLKISMEKIENEFNLLQDLGADLASQSGNNPTQERAIRDSFLIHFRRIHNFLYVKEPENKYITAADFFETADIWKGKRIKEPKIVRDFEKLADNIIQDSSYGDDVVIQGINRDDFGTAVQEIGRVFNQFIELNLPIEEPGEPVTKSGDIEEAEMPAQKETEITVKEYGKDKVLYRTCRNPEGILEVQVLHSNKSVINLITAHQDEPEYFLTNLEKFSGHQQSARKWLAEVVADNKSLFEKNKVIFIISESD